VGAAAPCALRNLAANGEVWDTLALLVISMEVILRLGRRAFGDGNYHPFLQWAQLPSGKLT
jgi:hypothetical protein